MIVVNAIESDAKDFHGRLPLQVWDCILNV